jgi:hypothetical protein
MRPPSSGPTGTRQRSSRLAAVLLSSLSIIPNWALSLQIGDFGTIDKKTGELKVEGNIYTHPEVKHIAQEFPAFEAAETDLYQIHSQQVKRLDVKGDAGS